MAVSQNNSGIVTTWYLDYQGGPLLLPQWPVGFSLIEAEVISPEFSQFLFSAVGTPWGWFSRLSWTYQDWLDYLGTGQVRTWVLYQRGTPAGFIELWRHPEDDNSVELKFFGIMPAFIGQGLGPQMALAAIALAQQWSRGRIWVHTCSDDHPAALKTYQQAGFVLVGTEQEVAELPADYADIALAAPYVQSRLERFKRN